ncbi:MAG: amidohydrolase family protein [Halarchaeum sp.]
MCADADVAFVNGEVHTLGEPDETYEGVAVRDGRVTRLDSDYEIEFSVGVETTVVDLGGRVLVPGFADADARLVAADADATTGAFRRAQRDANARGVSEVTAVAPSPEAAGLARDLSADDDLSLRVTLDHGRERLDALAALGARTGHGDAWVRTGALAVPAVGEGGLSAAARRETVRRADDAGLRVAGRARESAAVAALLDDYEGETPDPAGHRVVGVESVTSTVAERLADLGVVAVARPDADAVPILREAGARVAFGSDGAVRDPLSGVAAAADAGVPVTDALRLHAAPGDALGSAGSSDAPPGALTVGSRADFAVLDGSPWAADPADAAVSMTVVDGDVVHDAR